MRKLFYILIFLPAFLNAQVYQAGTIYPFYFDITPDTVLNYYYSGPSHLDDESYFIDINNDLQNDLRIRARAVSSPGGGNGYISITSLNTNTFKRYGRSDFTVGRRVALPLIIGDSINALTSIWDTMALMLTYDNVSFSVYTGVGDWYSSNDLFIGIKYEGAVDTLFGWLRVNCYRIPPNVYCHIKDYSFQFNCVSAPSITASSSSSLICSGETATLSASGANSYTWSTGNNGPSIVVTPSATTSYTVNGTSPTGCIISSVMTQSVDACIGIREHELNKINIYPNPANDKLFLQNTNSAEVKKYLLHDVTGKEIPLIQKEKGEFDVSTLAEGLYFLQLQTNEGVLTKKIVIQR